ncbi:MAG: hypothetical protein PVF13_07550, partial [Chromatiales bacterium]
MVLKKHYKMFYNLLLVLAILMGWCTSSFAHHPEIQATATCDIGSGFNINYESWSWKAGYSNADIKILFDGVVVGFGSYTDPDYAFSGSAPAPAGVVAGGSVVVTARADANWVNDATGNVSDSPGDVTTITVSLPDDNCNVLGDRVWEDLNSDGV